MRELKTISLKVNLDKKVYLPLLKHGRQLFNDFIDWIWKNGTYNKNKLHKECYRPFIEKYPTIKAVVHQSIRDMASECAKRQKIKGKQPTKKSFSIRLNCLCFTLRGRQLTLIGSDKRHKEILHISDYYKHIYENWNPKNATLGYDKKKKQFWLHITFENPKEPKIISSTKPERILGIDRGVYNPVATSDGKLVGNGKEIRRIKSNYQYLRQQLQKKGTHSAKRKLCQVSGKEKRFVLNTNHCLSKQIANSNNDVFVLEKLKKIKTNKYAHKLNRKLMSWSFFEFDRLLTYKANALGKLVVKVNPAFTSQTCSQCGVVDKTQRVGNKYHCMCGNRMHSDINAAINIKNKYLNSLETLQFPGADILQPIVTTNNIVSYKFPLKEV